MRKRLIGWIKETVNKRSKQVSISMSWKDAIAHLIAAIIAASLIEAVKPLIDWIARGPM